MIDYQELKTYPICDTDIWVDINIAKIDNLLFSKYEKIIVADVVENEILWWKSNKEFSFISENFCKYKSIKKIIVLNHSDINDVDKALFDKQLLDLSDRYGFNFKSGFKDNPHDRNKGEIVSAIYADNYKIPFLKSNDGTFKHGKAGRAAFPNLIVKDRRQMLLDLLDDENQVFTYNQKIDDGRIFMDEGKRIYETEEASEEYIMKKLQKLIGK